MEIETSGDQARVYGHVEVIGEGKFFRLCPRCQLSFDTALLRHDETLKRLIREPWGHVPRDCSVDLWVKGTPDFNGV